VTNRTPTLTTFLLLASVLRGSHGRGTIFTWRGLVNLGCLLFFILALLMLL